MDKTFWRSRKVFVTGATGLVGSWLVKALVEHGSDVVVLVRDAVPDSLLVQSGLMDQVNAVTGDVTNQMLLERVLGEFEVETVFHLAAQTIVGVANRNAVSTFHTNVGGTVALLEACRRSPKVTGVVVASSDKAYGEAKTLPYNEDTPLLAVQPYDVSKACTDMITASYAKTCGVPALTTRCGNFFGGGDLNWSRIVPSTIRSLIRNERPIIRSDGSLIRDYFYVEDGALAYMACAEAVTARRDLHGEAFNLSYGNPHSVIDLVNRISRMMNKDLRYPPIVEGKAHGEIQAQHLDSRKARAAFGWQPKFALEDGLKATILWYEAFLTP